MASRYNDQDDRYGDRQYGRAEYSGRRFGNQGFRQERDWRERRPYRSQFERDDEDQFRPAERYTERNYERQYGTEYDPGYGMSSESRYGNRFEPRNYGRGGEREYSRYGVAYGRGDYGRERNYTANYRERRPSEERGWWERMSDEVASWFGDEAAERRRRMDEMSAGSHRGKGPRGYRRSDERIKEDINDRLTDYSHLDASDIDVSVNEGVVMLDGMVDSRWAKRSAEDIVETVSGVKDVQNNLRVGREKQETIDAGTELLGSSASKARAKGA